MVPTLQASLAAGALACDTNLGPEGMPPGGVFKSFSSLINTHEHISEEISFLLTNLNTKVVVASGLCLLVFVPSCGPCP